jgi:hypothetical protein
LRSGYCLRCRTVVTVPAFPRLPAARPLTYLGPGPKFKNTY